MMSRHSGVRRGVVFGPHFSQVSVPIQSPFQAKKELFFGRGSGCFDPQKTGAKCCQVPSFVYKTNGDQRGTVGVTYLKNSSIDKDL